MSRLSSRNLYSSVAALSLTLAMGAPARAQTATPVGTQADSQEEIIVTAQRRAERLEAVPISITSVSGADLSRRGVDAFTELGQVSVGTQVSRVGVFVQPAVRGVTTTLVGGGQENNVAYYVDGFYQPFTISNDADLLAVENVSILKGPQGTLYGRNSTGGAILVTTANPSLDRTVGRASLSYRRFDDKRAAVYASAPLSTTVAASISGYFRDSDGYLYDIAQKIDAAPVKQRNIRGKLLWQASDTLRFILGGSYNYVSNPVGVNYGYVAHQSALILAPNIPIATGRYQRSATFPQKVVSKNSNIQLTTELDLGWAKLSSYTQYLNDKNDVHFDIDGTPANFSDAAPEYFQKAYSEEFSLASTTDGAVNWIVGGLYYRADVDAYTTSLTPSTGIYARNLGTLDSRAIGVFGEVTYKMTDALSITGGLRYSREKRAHLFQNPVGRVILPETTATFDAFTPRAVVRYELAPRTNVYASFSQGFKSGTYNSAGPSGIPVKPEKITAYEVGFKTASGPLRFDTAAFYYDYKNLQVSSTIEINGVRNTVLTNAAASEIYGAEASLSYSVTNRLNVNAALGYLHARYKNYTNAAASAVLNLNPAFNAIGGQNVSGFAQDWSGQRMIRSPDWTATFAFDYTQPVGDGALVLSGNLAWQSKFSPTSATRFQTYNSAVVPNVFSPLGDARYVQNPYAVVNLQLMWKLPGDKLRLAVFGENVTNSKYALQRNGGPQGDYLIAAQPVTWGVRADFDF